MRRFVMVLLGIAAPLTFANQFMERQEYVKSVSKPTIPCPAGATCTDFIQVPGLFDMWTRAIQDGPDVLPIRKQIKPPSYPIWQDDGDGDKILTDGRWIYDTERRERPERYASDETVQEEFLSVVPEAAIEYHADFCTDSDSECRAALTKGCQDYLKTTNPIDFQAYEYDSVDKVCKGRCAGNVIKCTVEEVNQKPKPAPRKPNEV